MSEPAVVRGALLDAQPGPGVAAAAAWLRSVVEEGRRVVIASLGPAGTSAHHALTELDSRSGGSLVDIELLASFGDVLDRLLSGGADLALIPSACRDATAFHWHPRLRLMSVFVHATPDYGLAVRPESLGAGEGPVVVAAMSEVEDLFAQLAPGHLARTPVERRAAASTSDAAAMVATGRADVAVCNDLGRRDNMLQWIGRRDGVDIVWMLFGPRGDDAAHPAGTAEG